MLSDYTYSDIERRWPRLLRALRWQGILTRSEAVGVVYSWLHGIPYAGEAQHAYGPIEVLLADSIRNREYSYSRHYGERE